MMTGHFQFGCSVVSDFLQLHELQLTRLPWPLSSSRAFLNSCPLSLWCCSTISSSVIPFSSYLQSFPTSGSFPMSQLFVSGGQSTGASASVLPTNIHDWFPLGGTLLISVLSKVLSRVFSNTTVQKHQFLFMAQFSHPYRTTGKTIALTIQTFVSKVVSLLFNMLFRFVFAFLPRSECLLISWLQSLSTVTLEPKKVVCHYFHCFPIYLPWNDRIRCHDLSFLTVEF